MRQARGGFPAAGPCAVSPGRISRAGPVCLSGSSWQRPEVPSPCANRPGARGAGGRWSGSLHGSSSWGPAAPEPLPSGFVLLPERLCSLCVSANKRGPFRARGVPQRWIPQEGDMRLLKLKALSWVQSWPCHPRRAARSCSCSRDAPVSTKAALLRCRKRRRSWEIGVVEVKHIPPASSTASCGCCSRGAVRVGSKMQLPRVKLRKEAARTVRFRVPRALEQRRHRSRLKSSEKPLGCARREDFSPFG